MRDPQGEGELGSTRACAVPLTACMLWSNLGPVCSSARIDAIWLGTLAAPLELMFMVASYVCLTDNTA